MFQDPTDVPVQEDMNLKQTRDLAEILMNVSRIMFALVGLKYVRTLQEVTNATISSVRWVITMILRNQGR